MDKKRWLVLVASCLINLCIGSIYAWSVFAAPLAEKFGVGFTPASLAIVFTVANSVGPITMISGGAINDRLGPRWVVITGGTLFGLGMFASGFANGLPLLIIGYGLGCGLGMGMVYGCTISNSVKFFPDKRGLIGGIATATYGLSSVLIPPVANKMIQLVGVSSTFKILGIVFTIVIIVCGLVIEKCPEGYKPSGWIEAGGAESGKVQENKDWKAMLADPTFYIMICMLLCGAFSGLMITSQASPMAQKIVGMTPAMAAIAVSVLALFNAAGRVCAGLLSDKLGRVNVLRLAFTLEIIGLISLLISEKGSMIVFLIGLSLMGICFGALMGVYPGFTADQFGSRNNSVNYGIMFIGFAVAGFFGPTVAGKSLAAFGTYSVGFFIAVGLSLLGIILSIVMNKYNK